MPMIQWRDSDVAALEARRQDPGESLGLIAKRMLARYTAHLARERESLRPLLTRQEVYAVLDALNGWWQDDVVGDYALLWAEVADAEGLGERWGVDQEDLVRRLRGLTLGQRLALADVAQQFWSHPGDKQEALLESCSHVPAG